MVIYVIFGGAIALLLALSLHSARSAWRAARTNGQSLARLEERVAELRGSVQQELAAMSTAQRMEAASQSQAGVRQSLELQTEMRSLADLQQQEFSRVRALFEVLPHSIAALKREQAQIQESTGQIKTQLEASFASQTEQLAARIERLQESTAQANVRLEASSAAQNEQLAAEISLLEESIAQLKVRLEASSAERNEQLAGIAQLQVEVKGRLAATMATQGEQLALVSNLQESTGQLKVQLGASFATQSEQLAQITQLQVEVKDQLEATRATQGHQSSLISHLQESTGQLKVQLEASSVTQSEQLAQIRANLPPPKPGYEDPVPFIEALPEADVLRIAESLTFVRPLTPYPNWYFDVDWQNPDLGYRIRRSIWTYFSRRKTTACLDIPWYDALKLRIYLGNDLSRQQFVAGCIDPNEFALLDKLLTPGMVFLDVGANEGFYTVFASHCVGNTGTVWAFEPSRREMDHLTTNVQLNGLANVRSFCVALADEDTRAEFSIAGDEHSGHNTLGQFVYDSELARRESISLRRLDSLLQEGALERLDFLKIDVEGAEQRVLAGARGALSRFRPLILLEVNDRSLKSQGSSRDDLIRFLESQAYRLYLFDPATGLPVPAFEGRYGANMLAVPVERNLPERALMPLPATRRRA